MQLRIVPNHTTELVETIEPSNLVNQNYVENLLTTPIVTDISTMKRRQSNSSIISCASNKSSSSLSSYSSSSSEEDDNDSNTFSVLNSSQKSDLSSDSEEEEPIILTPYIPRRQMEEMILDKITNQLDPEKLPGILTIISTNQEEEDEADEVEIDLARLEHDQLSRILSYIDACLLEKKGGPMVKLSDYSLVSVQPDKVVHPSVAPKKEKASVDARRRQTQQQIKQGNSRRRRRRKSIVESGHVVHGSSTTQLSSSHGPISMSALTEMEEEEKKVTKTKRKRKMQRRDDSVPKTKGKHQESKKNSYNDVKKAKRKRATHKRRLLEDMLQPSNNLDDKDDEEGWNGGSGIVIFSNEKMDFGVTQNQTIVHQERKASIQKIEKTVSSQYDKADNEDEDEIIDILM
ncbi:MAG: hypothetical protein EXX96DRAFT_577137 [Benjaminiella poitrasii]|nr:MAG: hypothetical protein EXX96DRAFT_577137 [Benjaminiella poitrasii]